MKKLSTLLLLVSMLLLAKTTLYAQTPTISSFTPTSGAPGTLFTITGTNLSSPTAFKIGGVTASAIVVSNTGTSLVGMVMPSAATGTIAVTTAGGTATSSGTFTVQNTSYPIVQQGTKLVGTSALVTPGQGWAVALSADGTTALVGGYYDNNGVGATWVYTRSGNTWAQQAKLIGTGAATNAWQGFSVALSADGNTAIVGGVIDNSAWVFTRSGTTWAQQGNKLVASDRVGNAWFGKSVALSADGNTAIVGGYSDNTNAGAAWVFTRSVTTWTQQGTKLVGTGPVGAAGQGTAVALSADGNIAAIGGATDDTNKGATWVFTRSGTTWTQQGNKLIGTGAAGADKQGQSVALSADATTLFIGGVNATSNVSNAWVFTRSGTTWSQQGSKLAGSDAVGTAANGTSVTLTADGNTAMMGSVSDNNNTGAAWVFIRSGSTWAQQGNKLLGTGATGTSLYEGRSVSLSADGSTALVGADGDNTNQGAVWAYSTGVIYDGNGNTGGTVPSSALATIGSSITLATNTGTLVKTGYTFAGWNTLANGTGTSYAEGASYTFAGTVRLYAKWTINNYTVTFNANSGTGSMSNQTIEYNASANLTSNAFNRTGYTFAGWNTLANVTGTSYANGTSYTMGAANVTLYAQWTLNNYTVTFNVNGGTGSMSNQTITYNASSNLTSNAFTRTGYTFAGWNTLANGTGTSYANGISYTMGATNVTLYAQWMPNNYTITFNANSGTGTMTDQSIGYTSSTNLTTNAFTRTGYTFAGWNTLVNGTGTSYANGTSYTMGAANVTLYAQWTVNNYTVTFNANSGTGSMSNQTIDYNASSNLTSNAFTRTGYTFAGWNTLANGTGTSYANGASYTMGAVNVTLYAKWNCITTVSTTNLSVCANTPTYTWNGLVRNAPGTYTYTSTNSIGCDSVATLNLTITDNNTAGTASSTPTLCINALLTNITHTTTGATGIGTATGLPAGVTAAWATNTITISGIPTVSGTFNYSIPLTGGCGNVNATGTITVTASNTVGTASSTPTICINTALTNITHTTTGATGIGTAIGLPTGVSASWANDTITISGLVTNDNGGTYYYSIPLTGGCGSVNATGTITVKSLMTVRLAFPKSGPFCINSNYIFDTYNTTGATGIGTATGLPAGVSTFFDNSFIYIIGTPTEFGIFNYSIPLTGGCGSVNATGTLTINSNTVGTASSTPTLCINTALTIITHTTAGATGIGYATGLPTGVIADWTNNTITISGTPTASGIFNYSIPLTGGCGNVNAIGTITINSSTVGTASSTPTLCINTALTNITHTTSGATGIGTATSLPAGVTAAWANNVITISGTPTASGIFNYSIPLTVGCGTATATGTITVIGNMIVGDASSTPILCINSTLTNITYTTSNTTGIGTAIGLPTGVSASWANNTITISGTPTASGIFTYSIPLTGGCSSVSATGTITVTAAMAISLLPLDNVPNASLALSLRKLRSAYSGPALRLRRGSDNVEQDFAFVGNDLDLNAITTWLNGASGYCTKLYDQSGNGGDVYQTIAAAQPLLVLSGFNNKPLLRFTTAQTMYNAVNYPAPFSVIYGSRVIGTSARVLSAKNNNWLLGYWGGSQDRAYFVGWTSEGSATTVLNQYNIYAGIGTGSISTVYKNGVQIASNSNGVQGPNGIQLNGSGESGSPTETSNCEFTDVIVYGSALPAATVAQLSDNNGLNFEPQQSVCINTPLSNITQITTRASGIGTATGLPAGVSASWANNTITISGTPTESGIFNYSIPLTGGCGSVNATGTITVNANMIAGAASSTPTLCVNTALTNITHTTTAATGINTYPAPYYAMPPAISIPTSYDDLENVTITSNGATVLNNTTPINSLSGTIGTASGTVGSYADFTVFGPYAMYPGATYSFSLSSITTTVSRSNAMAIYIDYNRNGLFTDDGEKVYAAATTTPGPHTETGTFTIPLSASFGLTRMRVICGNAIISSPTQGFSLGEYEEYSINLGRSGGLPAGLSASWTNNTVTISGTPTESGIFNYSIGLTGDCSTAAATGTITVNPADLQPSAGNNGNLTICSTTNLTAALLFAALRGTPAAGGVWSPTPDVANGSMTYTYTQPEIAPCGLTSATVAVIVTTPTVVGNDLTTSVITGKNIAITPNIAPASTTALMGYTNTNFKGLIAVDPTTGVIKITNAHPAGTYSVIVKASDQGCAFATVALTVTNPICSQRQFITNPTLTFSSSVNVAAVVDFNGDGKQDIATAHGSGVINSTGSVSIRLGDGLGGFSGSTNVAVGSYPRSIAIGDFNRDGKQDIAAANYNSATVSILLGDGLGGLSAATNVAVGVGPQSVALGDFNRDGKQDIATANNTSNTVSILLGDGLGGFSGTTNVTVGEKPSSVAVGDFNSDGKQDIATANAYTLSIRLGDGLGGFSGTKNAIVYLGSDNMSIAIVDFNGDGKQDITTTAQYGGVSISLGDGLGGISGTTYISGFPSSQAIGDFNGDGKQDIIGVGSSTIFILSDDGLGGYSFVKQVLSTANLNLTRPTVGDFNGDGIQDIAIIRQTNPGYIFIRLGSNGAEINLKGNGVSIPSGNTNISLSDNTDLGTVTTRAFTIQNTGTNALPITNISISGTDASFFIKTGITLPAVIAAGSEITFNVNCFSTTLGTKTATVTINSDDCDESAYTFNVQRTLSTTPTLGNYTNATVPTAGGNATIIPSAAPTNYFGITATTSAGFKGKLAVDAATGTVRITNAQPAGTYQIIVHAGFGVSKTFTLEVGNTRCSNGQFLSPIYSDIVGTGNYTQVADFNNDGYQDFAVILTPSTFFATLNVRLGNGSGGFTNATSLTISDNLSYFTIDDFNGDGNADIVVKGTNTIYACIGNGLGGFTIGENVVTSSFSIGSLNSILSDDVDQDGKIDLVVTGTSGFAVLKGNGIGGFSLLNTYSNGINFNYIEKGDFNGDGNIDLSMAGNAGNHIYLGNGAGGFIAGQICNIGGYYRFSTVGDFDGDGKSDILSALGNIPGTVAFLKNNGDGSFAAPTFTAVSDEPYQVVSGDFNGDGKLDFAAVNSNFNYELRNCSVSVRYGNGDGTFYGTTELVPGEFFGYLTFNVADFNNDGIQDLGISENDNRRFTVYLGAPSPIEINVQGNGVDIVSGDSSPAGADDTDFGTTTPNTPITKTYTIQNGGTSDLVVSAIALSGTAAASFTVGGIALPATIATGTSTTFTVTFNTSTLGVQSATVSINNNDCDEGVYTFKVQGRDNTYTVTFNANGGTGTMTNKFIAYLASANLTANTLTRTGYTFSGWATTSGGAVAYANSASYTMSAAADVTLYAKWCLNSASTTNVAVFSTSPTYLWNGIVRNAPGTYTYNTTNAIGCDSVATLNLTVVDPILPVTGIDLSGTASDKQVKLSYKALNEREMANYTIERSAEGTSFTQIGMQQPINGTQASASYGFIDNQPFVGMNYYRIQGNSLNGQLQYSNVIAVKAGNMMPKVTVAPNPILHQVLNLKLNQLEKGNYKMVITDVTGRTVYGKQLLYDGVGTFIKTNLPISIKPGIYYVRLSGEGNDFMDKFIIQ